MEKYIVLNKNKIEERIKELEQLIETTFNSKVLTLYEGRKELLKELLKESIDAQEVFNAGRECSEEYDGGGEYNILSYCGDEPIAKHSNWEEYTKTLNI